MPSWIICNLQALLKVCELTHALLDSLYENVSPSRGRFPQMTDGEYC